uniref:Arrestin_N domain-containing protein n=1 Tax=Heligmosomoides polygyrus TaxID=6339 RepID=A0A8L8JMY8_HELPZ
LNKDEHVQGVIDVGCTREVRIGGLLVRLTGVVETGWRNKNSDLSYESRHNFMDELIDLTTMIADHCTEEFYLLEGRHSVPFEARLPMDVLSSVNRDNYGSVRYTCTALMAIPEDGDTEMVAEKTFKVFPYLNLDAPYMRDSTSTTEEELIVGCCGRKRGTIVASMKVQEEHHECVLISLCQQLDFVSTNRYETHLMDRKSVTIAVESHGTCKARPGSGPETKEIEFSIPSHLPPTSIHADRLVTISYFFKLDLEQFDIIVPVIIGTSKTPGTIE